MRSQKAATLRSACPRKTSSFRTRTLATITLPSSLCRPPQQRKPTPLSSRCRPSPSGSAASVWRNVHRTKTRFAARVNHVATALERRGVRATYALHERVLSNRRSRRRFASERPVLDDAQRRIVAELEEQGFSLLTFSELCEDESVMRAIEEQASQFAAETEDALTTNREALRVRAGKEFVVRLHSYG